MTTSPDTTVKSFKLPKWTIFTAVILALLVGVALVIPSFLDQNKYKGIIIQKVEEATGYKVSWAGDLGIAILPVPHVTINEAAVSTGTQKIISVKKAEISVALMPLLQKKVQISSVNLVEPDVALIVDASGRQTWMTDKLSQQKDAATPATNAPAEQKQAQEISLDSVHVENGHIVYKDMSKGTVQEVSALNTDLSVKSLSGPFDVKSDFVYNGNAIEIKGNAGALAEGKPTVVNFDVELPKLNVSGNYTGEITTGNATSVKGDLKFTTKDLEKTLSALSKTDTKLPKGLNAGLSLNTAVLYDGDNASLDDLHLSLGDLTFKGGVKLTGLKSSPSPKLAVDLVSTSKNVKSSEAIVNILADLSVKGAGTFVNNVVTIEQGNIGFEGQNIALAGTYALPAKSGARPRVNATINASKIDVDDLSQQLNPATESAAQKAVNAKESAPVATTVKGVSLPFDGNLSGQVGALNVGGKSYSNVNFNIVSNGNALTINNFSLNAVADTSIAAKGTIADLSKLSGFDIAANVKTGNVEGLAKAYNIPLKLQQTLGAASVNGNFKGSLDKLGFNATVDALKFAVTGAGTVQSLLSTPQIETLNLRVQHPSLQEAVRNFSPGFEAPGSFAGALDLSTTIALNGKKYDLSNIKGTIGSTSIAGALSADTGAAKPSLSGNLNFGNMVFDSPAPAAGSTTASAKPSSAPAASSSETRWSREAIDTAWMDQFNADLSIKAASITQGLWKLTNANLAFKLNDGSLVISNMDANAFGGNIAINGDMKGGSAKAPLAMNWTAKATSLNAQQLLSALQNKQSDTLSGTIKNFDVSISSTGNSPAALVYALSGKGSSTGSDLVIKGVDAAKLADAAKGSYKPLERAGSLFGSFKDGQTSFSTFDMAFNIASGVVNFTQIKFDGDKASLSSTGNVNLPRWTVDLKNTMTVKNSEVPPFDFTISGPLDNPLQAGGSVIEKFLKDKAQTQIQNLITDKLGKKLGIPLGGTTTATDGATTQPASTTTNATDPNAAAAPVEKTKEQKKAEQIQQGVQAIQGLFGH